VVAPAADVSVFVDGASAASLGADGSFTASMDRAERARIAGLLRALVRALEGP